MGGMEPGGFDAEDDGWDVEDGGWGVRKLVG